MQVKDFLLPRNVLTDVRGADKISVVRELARAAGAALEIPADAIASALLKREQLGSTGMGNGIAIPHARVAAVTHPFGLFARLKQPVEFDAVDGQPVDLVFVLLLPAAEGDINALACAARSLRDPDVLAALRNAKDGKALYRLLTS